MSLLWIKRQRLNVEPNFDFLARYLKFSSQIIDMGIAFYCWSKTRKETDMITKWSKCHQIKLIVWPSTKTLFSSKHRAHYSAWLCIFTLNSEAINTFVKRILVCLARLFFQVKYFKPTRTCWICNSLFSFFPFICKSLVKYQNEAMPLVEVPRTPLLPLSKLSPFLLVFWLRMETTEEWSVTFWYLSIMNNPLLPSFFRCPETCPDYDRAS